MRLETPPVRIVFIMWMFTCVIYSATYSGNLVAFLAVDIELPPFASLEELSKQDNYRFGVMGGTSYITTFQVTLRKGYLDKISIINT